MSTVSFQFLSPVANYRTKGVAGAILFYFPGNILVIPMRRFPEPTEEFKAPTSWNLQLRNFNEFNYI